MFGAAEDQLAAERLFSSPETAKVVEHLTSY